MPRKHIERSRAAIVKQPRSPGAARVAAACSIALGPCGAWLYESGRLDFFVEAYVLNLWVAVFPAIAGIVVGVYAVVRGARLLGFASLLINSAVAALYGFLAVFFGFGGSR